MVSFSLTFLIFETSLNLFNCFYVRPTFTMPFDLVVTLKLFSILMFSFTEVDQCSELNLCQNGATCIPLGTGCSAYICQCPSCFTGPTCDMCECAGCYSYLHAFLENLFIQCIKSHQVDYIISGSSRESCVGVGKRLGDKVNILHDILPSLKACPKLAPSHENLG